MQQGDKPATDRIKAISTGNAPQPIGPYSQAIEYGGLIFCSGQLPVDPKTGELVAGGMKEQARQVFENLGAVLAAAGSGMDRVLKVTVYMTDLGKFGELNGVYAEYFIGKPARATVQVAGLPKGAEVEVDAIAAK